MLRDYQTELLNKIFSSFREGYRRPLVVAPCGAGKSYLFVELIKRTRGEALILTSDGVQAEEVLHRLRIDPAEPPGEVASCLLEHGAREGTDDATVAVIRLRSTPLST